jgi:succinyl-CoA synthetase beta subunit
MNLHEYQSKELFAQHAIPTPCGKVADSPEGAVAAAQGLSGSLWVVKAQVHAGGRGKAAGVKVVRDLEGVRAAAEAMLGSTLVTHQTGPQGLPVHQVYVEVGSKIAREIYQSHRAYRCSTRQKRRSHIHLSMAGVRRGLGCAGSYFDSE